MDLNKMLGELKFELEQVDQAILSLERLLASRGKRRGRPSKWARAAKSDSLQPDSAKPDSAKSKA